jgi:hypothetical protein
MNYLKSLFVGILNLTFIGFIAFVVHIVAMKIQWNDPSNDAVAWDPGAIDLAWLIVFSVCIFVATASWEFHKLTRKPTV